MVSELRWYWAPVLIVGGALGTYLALKTPADALPAGMVAIPAGTFEMGTKGRGSAEPAHQVALGAFQVDINEVSVRDYDACVAAGACTRADSYVDSCNAGKERAEHPINCVHARQAAAYCRWRGKRLLSEEEWEYTARASHGAAYPWGSALPQAQPCWRRSEKQGTCPIGSHRADLSHFGVLDMAGNVAEWTASGYSKAYDKPREHYQLVARGGHYASATAQEIDAFQRASFVYNEADSKVGMRCARSVD